MFTGIVQGIGDVFSVEKRGRTDRGQEAHFRIRPRFVWPRPQVGESVAVNGACLTVETWQGSPMEFSAYASTETLAHTTLGGLSAGARVNLERALALGDRLGGHLVSGHVDAVARVEAVRQEGDSRRVRFAFDPVWSGQVIPKGSVALDGVSLTVNACGPGFLEVNVIPETWRATAAEFWKPGRAVNLETDMIGKYVRHALEPLVPGGGSGVSSPGMSGGAAGGMTGGVTLDFLREHGF